MTAVPVDVARIQAADCVVILTDHPEFDYRQITASASLVVDTRNATWGIPSSTAEIIRL
jgi:UDP-N-acetyl-D-glucosamine dehydrogenase